MLGNATSASGARGPMGQGLGVHNPSGVERSPIGVMPNPSGIMPKSQGSMLNLEGIVSNPRGRGLPQALPMVRPEQRMCRVCGKWVHKANLCRHMAKHSDVTKFQCKQCGRRFKWHSSLKSHRCQQPLNPPLAGNVEGEPQWTSEEQPNLMPSQSGEAGNARYGPWSNS